VLKSLKQNGFQENQLKAKITNCPSYYKWIKFQ
jgi:hypothetical protein